MIGKSEKTNSVLGKISVGVAAAGVFLALKAPTVLGKVAALAGDALKRVDFKKHPVLGSVGVGLTIVSGIFIVVFVLQTVTMLIWRLLGLAVLLGLIGAGVYGVWRAIQWFSTPRAKREKMVCAATDGRKTVNFGEIDRRIESLETLIREKKENRR